MSPQEKVSELWSHWSELGPQAEWSQGEGEGLPAILVRSTRNQSRAVCLPSHTPGLRLGLFYLQKGDCPLDMHVGPPNHRASPELLFSQPDCADGQPQAGTGFSQSAPCQALTEA